MSNFSKETHPTRELLLERFEYRGGELFYRYNVSSLARKGAKAGFMNANGYYGIRIDKVLWYTHQLVWIMFNNNLTPGKQIDHIDRNKTDNRIENLREVSSSINLQNQIAPRVDNQLGERNIHWSDYHQAFKVQIIVNGKKAYATAYTIEEAINKRDQLLISKTDNSIASEVSKVGVGKVMFSNEDIANIRKLSKEGLTNDQIGSQYGCKRGTIWNIVTYKNYRHLP